MTPHRPLRLMMATATVALIAACDGPLDFDLRDLGDGFDTTPAVQNLEERPAPDNRGIISYPNYQVVVANSGDTPTTIATRLGLDPNTLAAFNGLEPDTALRRDEILALPSRVAEPSPATGATTTGPITPTQVDVTTLAGAAIDRADETTTTPLPPAETTTTPVIEGVEPIRHQVARGETLFSIARLYGVPPRAIAEWNGLGADLMVREGQFLLIANGGATPAPVTPAAVEAPGTGSETPVPPSADDPLPETDDIVAAPADGETATTPPVEVPDLGAEQTEVASDAPMIMPVSGSIIRAFAPGRNDGIDIGASAGSPVAAAADGTVAAITTDTAGIQIVVIRHAGSLLTVYTHLDNLTVSRGDSVRQGQPIGSVRAGDPSFLHFEVRRGTDAQDPNDFLP